jgi:hypothetical protein
VDPTDTCLIYYIDTFTAMVSSLFTVSYMHVNVISSDPSELFLGGSGGLKIEALPCALARDSEK